MSVADSGEYVCRANNNIDAQEASIVVSVSPSTRSPAGESNEGPGRDWQMQRAGLPGEEGLCRPSPHTSMGALAQGQQKDARFRVLPTPQRA